MNKLSFCPRNKLLHALLSEFVWKIVGNPVVVTIHHVTAVGNNALQFEYEAEGYDGRITFGRLVYNIEGE